MDHIAVRYGERLSVTSKICTPLLPSFNQTDTAQPSPASSLFHTQRAAGAEKKISRRKGKKRTLSRGSAANRSAEHFPYSDVHFPGCIYYSKSLRARHLRR